MSMENFWINGRKIRAVVIFSLHFILLVIELFFLNPESLKGNSNDPNYKVKRDMILFIAELVAHFLHDTSVIVNSYGKKKSWKKDIINSMKITLKYILFETLHPVILQYAYNIIPCLLWQYDSPIYWFLASYDNVISLYRLQYSKSAITTCDPKYQVEIYEFSLLINES